MDRLEAEIRERQVDVLVGDIENWVKAKGTIRQFAYYIVDTINNEIKRIKSQMEVQEYRHTQEINDLVDRKYRRVYG